MLLLPSVIHHSLTVGPPDGIILLKREKSEAIKVRQTLLWKNHPPACFVTLRIPCDRGQLFRGAQNKVFCPHKILPMISVLSRLHVGPVGQAEHLEHYVFWSEEASLMQSVYTMVFSGQGLSLYFSHNVQIQDCYFCLEQNCSSDFSIYHSISIYAPQANRSWVRYLRVGFTTTSMC